MVSFRAMACCASLKYGLEELPCLHHGLLEHARTVHVPQAALREHIVPRILRERRVDLNRPCRALEFEVEVDLFVDGAQRAFSPAGWSGGNRLSSR